MSDNNSPYFDDSHMLSRPWWFSKQDGDLDEFPETFELISEMGYRAFIVLPDGTEAVVFQRPEQSSLRGDDAPQEGATGE